MSPEGGGRTGCHSRPSADPSGGPPGAVPGSRWRGSAVAWQGGPVTEPVSAPTGQAGPADLADWLTLPDVAERLDVRITRVHQMIRDGQLIEARREGIRRIPADLVANATVLKHLPGVLTLLRDAGYDDEAALRWLYEEDDTLPGTPAVALGGDRAREVKRRAQALGY